MRSCPDLSGWALNTSASVHITGRPREAGHAHRQRAQRGRDQSVAATSQEMLAVTRSWESRAIESSLETLGRGWLC